MDVLLVPSECTRLLPVRLPCPKQPKNQATQLLQDFLYDEDNIALYEMTKFADPYRSWFLDNQLCKDGHFTMLTRVNPLYLFLPQLIRFAGDKFRTLQDICAAVNDNSPDGASKIDYALSPDIDWGQVCETKELDNELFVRFSESKTLAWLSARHVKTIDALRPQLGEQASRATLISYAFDLIDQYLPESLSANFKELVTSNTSKLPETPSRPAVESAGKMAAAKTATPNNSNSKRPKLDQQQQKQKKEPPKGGLLNFFKKL